MFAAFAVLPVCCSCLCRRCAAGSAVSDLLDERLKRLEEQLDASDKACEGLSSQVLAFNKGTREVRVCAKTKSKTVPSISP